MASLDDIAALIEHLQRGEQLVGSASLVGDQDDFHIWRQKRNAWVRDAANALTTSHGDEHAEQLRAAARAAIPLSHWHAALDAEVEAARAAVEAVRSRVGLRPNHAGDAQ